MKSGKMLWDELCEKYYSGAAQVSAMQGTWRSLAAGIDSRRHREVADRLAIQAADSAGWRDHVLQYFQQFSGMPITPP